MPALRRRRTSAALAAVLATGVAASACSAATVGFVSDADPFSGGGAAQAPARAGALAPVVGTPATPQRPNVVLITADDASVQDMHWMPYTQRLLADRGVTFSDAIAPTPICVPARASLLTGQYAHNHRALTISGKGGGYQAFAAHDNRHTLPLWMQHAGYDTLFVGKYLNGYADNGRPLQDPGWTDWRAAMGMSTYSFVHTLMDDNGRVEQTTKYSTDLFTDQAVDMLSRPRRATRPFYLWVNYVGPHRGGPLESDDPEITNPTHPDEWIGTTMPAPRNRNQFANLDIPRNPALFRTNGPGQVTAGAPFDARKKASGREAFQQRIEALQSVDEGVRRIVTTLRARHQLRNTVLVFTSDNGYAEGDHALFGKLWQFNEMMRIPVIMAGPGVPQGKVVHTVITNPDIAVTLAHLAHAVPTRVVDGVNFMPWLTQPTKQRIVPIEGYPVLGGLQPLYTGVRVGPWTYIRLRNGHEELYNRAIDRFELSNLGRLQRYKGDLAWLRGLSRRYADCAGATCPKVYQSPAGINRQRRTAIAVWNARRQATAATATPSPSNLPAPQLPR